MLKDRVISNSLRKWESTELRRKNRSKGPEGHVKGGEKEGAGKRSKGREREVEKEGGRKGERRLRRGEEGKEREREGKGRGSSSSLG